MEPQRSHLWHSYTPGHISVFPLKQTVSGVFPPVDQILLNPMKAVRDFIYELYQSKNSQMKCQILVLVLLNFSETLDKTLKPSGFPLLYWYYQWVKVNGLQSNCHSANNTNWSQNMMRFNIFKHYIWLLVYFSKWSWLYTVYPRPFCEGWVANLTDESIRHLGQ